MLILCLLVCFFCVDFVYFFVYMSKSVRRKQLEQLVFLIYIVSKEILSLKKSIFCNMFS